MDNIDSINKNINKLHMESSSYWNNGHVCNWLSFTYFKLARYKSAKYIVHWYDTVSTNIIKIFSPNFYITASNIIVNLTMKSRLMRRSRQEPLYIRQLMSLSSYW